jgi:thymidylate synthase
MNKLDLDYQNLLKDILENGVKKETRNGDTISVFGRQIRHNMKDGFPLLTTKKMPFKTIVTELLWFLRGGTNIKFLVDNDCHIWDGDAYKNYRLKSEDIDLPENLYNKLIDDLNKDAMFPIGNPSRMLSKEEFINKIKTDDEFAKKWGELGSVYGKQWRRWTKKKMYLSTDGSYEKIFDEMDQTVIDQIAILINDLKTNPDSRRLMVNAWNVGELDQMVLPPCHYGFQVYTRELSIDEKEWQLEKTNCINDIENDRIIYGHDWEKYIQEQYDSIQSSQGIKLSTRAISLMWNQRSVDTFLGLPFNIASYGLFLEIIAKEVNMVPDELIGNLGDVHLYSNHIEQAKEQIGRDFTEEEIIEHLQQSGMDALKKEPRMEYIAKLYKRTRQPFPLPTFDCPVIDEIPHTTFDELVFKLQPADFYMDDYVSHPTIKAPLSN